MTVMLPPLPRAPQRLPQAPAIDPYLQLLRPIAAEAYALLPPVWRPVGIVAPALLQRLRILGPDLRRPGAAHHLLSAALQLGLGDCAKDANGTALVRRSASPPACAVTITMAAQ